MTLEMAVLNITPGNEKAFEAAMIKARPLIAATPGFRSLELRRCIEATNRYLLLVEWERLEDHTVKFRQSERYKEWRKLLHDSICRYCEQIGYESERGRCDQR